MLKNSRCFEFDRQFDDGTGGFVFFDYNHPENLPAIYKGYFDMLVIDPPFVTEDVWVKYSEAIKFLL